MDKKRKYICTDGRTAIVQKVGICDFYGEVYNTDGERIERARVPQWDYWLIDDRKHNIGVVWTRIY